MYYIFMKSWDYHTGDIVEVYGGSRKTAAEAKELCKAFRRTRGDIREIWYERRNEPDEQDLPSRGTCYNPRTRQ